MFKFLEDFYLITHDFDILLFLPFLFNRLYSHELTRELASGLVHMAICALPDQRDDMIIFLFVLGHRDIQII